MLSYILRRSNFVPSATLRTDPNLRNQYDSALPFDESLPTPSQVDENNPESFFDTFGPVFSRNER